MEFIDHLDAAINIYDETKLISEYHPDRVTHLNGVSVALQHRFKQMGSVDDLYKL
jgi:hypothetical protein